VQQQLPKDPDQAKSYSHSWRHHAPLHAPPGIQDTTASSGCRQHAQVLLLLLLPLLGTPLFTACCTQQLSTLNASAACLLQQQQQLLLLVRTSSPPMMWSMMPYSRASMGDMYLPAAAAAVDSVSITALSIATQAQHYDSTHPLLTRSIVAERSADKPHAATTCQATLYVPAAPTHPSSSQALASQTLTNRYR
jgi:hypothetical protein